jgi:hypothetical protein
VCEWGPEDGPRVLFLHGISTSCITLAKLAHGLAKRGCRVMLFVGSTSYRAIFVVVFSSPTPDYSPLL